MSVRLESPDGIAAAEKHLGGETLGRGSKPGRPTVRGGQLLDQPAAPAVRRWVAISTGHRQPRPARVGVSVKTAGCSGSAAAEGHQVADDALHGERRPSGLPAHGARFVAVVDGAPARTDAATMFDQIPGHRLQVGRASGQRRSGGRSAPSAASRSCSISAIDLAVGRDRLSEPQPQARGAQRRSHHVDQRPSVLRRDGRSRGAPDPPVSRLGQRRGQPHPALGVAADAQLSAVHLGQPGRQPQMELPWGRAQLALQRLRLRRVAYPRLAGGC